MATDDPPHLALVATLTFERLGDAWQLTAFERRRWLGEAQNLTPPVEELLERVSYALGIYQALHQLFPDPALANQWIRRHNSRFGCSALDYALLGQVPAMRAIRQYLDAQVSS